MRFDSYHPMINLVYFAGAFVCIVAFRHPVFLGISFAASFIWSVKLGGRRQLLFDMCLIPLVAVYGLYYASYHHFGVTSLRTNVIGNHITLESLIYGLALGTMLGALIMMSACVLRIVSEDKVVYLLGRIAPKLSMYLAIALRFIPRVWQRGKRIALSRRGIGMGITQGSPPERIRHLGSFISILITWTIEDFVESASSMKSRGCSLPGRTAFSIYRFDQRDRNVVLVITVLLTVMWAALAFDQTRIYYSPRIVMNKITPLSAVFYTAYVLFLLLPFGLQIAGEWRYSHERRHA